MAHKKAGGSSRNGRDSESKRLGTCTRFFDHHFFWEPACQGWKQKQDNQENP